MSDHFPYFFVPVEPTELSSNTGTLDEWTERYLTEHWDHLSQRGVRSTSSRNSIHQTKLQTLCEALSVAGLEFVFEPACCLAGERLETAREALDRVTDALASGRILTLTQPPARPRLSAWLASLPTLTAVFRGAPVAFDSSSDVDVGIDAERAFFSFVKSLRQAVLEALERSHWLIWFSPAAG